MTPYQRILGSPLVYDWIRPLVVGGLDLSPVYARLAPDDDSVVLDVGCGTGDALRYLPRFARYVGFDVDAVALRRARERAAGRPNVSFEHRLLEHRDVASLAPTHVAMVGLLHHLSNAEALEVLQLVRSSPRLVRIATLDIVFLPGERVSNALARLDRGRHCRAREGYEALARSAGLTVRESIVVRSHPKRGMAKYLVLELTNPAP